MIPTSPELPTGGMQQQMLLLLLQQLLGSSSPDLEEELLKLFGEGGRGRYGALGGFPGSDTDTNVGSPGSGPASGGTGSGSDILDFLYQQQKKAAFRAALAGGVGGGGRIAKAPGLS